MALNKDKNLSATAAGLRRHAEARLHARAADAYSPRSAEETQRLVHELEIHRIELEMQSDELTRVYEQLTHEIDELKKAEELVVEKKYILTEALRIAHIASWEVNFQDNEFICSDGIYPLFGIEQNERPATYDVILACVHPEDRSLVEVSYRRSMTEYIPYNIIHRIIRKSDGAVRHLHAQCSNVCNSEGRPVKSVGTVQDVTDSVVKESALKGYSSHVVKMIESERAGIARDLHDDLGQTMAALSFEVKRIQNLLPGTAPAVTESIANLFGHIDSMTSSINRIRTTLKPLLLDELGLEASLELLAEQLSAKSGIQIDVDCLCLANRCGKNSTHVFRIVNEALSNCLKHSRATHIAVDCVRLTDEILLEVTDNGVGFVYPDASDIKSFGLVGMRERAEILGARLDVRSVVNKGTVVSLYIPCTNKRGGGECDFS